MDARDGLPEVLAELLRVLVDANGFSVQVDYRGGMGGRHLVMRGPAASAPPAEIAFAGELGEWGLSLRFVGMQHFYSPFAWQALLDGGKLRIGEFSEQVEFVKERLGEAAEIVAELADVEERLRQLSDVRLI